VCVCVCLDANHGGTDRNCITEACNLACMMHKPANELWCTTKRGHSDLIFTGF